MSPIGGTYTRKIHAWERSQHTYTPMHTKGQRSIVMGKMHETSKVLGARNPHGWSGPHRANNESHDRCGTAVIFFLSGFWKPPHVYNRPMTTMAEIDAELIRYADSESAQAISFRIKGLLTPEQVITRIAQLTTSPDWLTATMQDNLITLKMRQLVARFEELPLTARNGEILLRGLEAIAKRLDQRQEATQKDLTSLYAFQGQAFLEATETFGNHLRESILALTDIDADEWDRHVETALRKTQIKLATHDIDAAPEAHEAYAEIEQ